MQIETYTDKYYLDVVTIVKNFHVEAVQEYDAELEMDALISTILSLKENQSENAFLLIMDGKCEGILAGLEVPTMINNNKVFQELIWYVNKPFRSRGVWLLNKVREILKDRGFTKMIMAVLENSKTDKIKSLYESMGFKKMEVHYIGNL